MLRIVTLRRYSLPEGSEDYASLGSGYYNQISSAKTAMESAEKSKGKTEEKIKEYESDIASGGNQDAINTAKKAIDDKLLEIDQATDNMMMETQARPPRPSLRCTYPERPSAYP